MSPRPRRRRWPMRIVGVAVLAAAIVGVWMLWFQPEDIYASPETVELPALPQDQSETAAYVAGDDGQLLRNVVVATEPLLQARNKAECEEVANSLDALGSPESVLAAIAGIPDRATADIAANHLAAVARFTGTCLEDGTAPSGDEIRFTHVIVSRRLEELTR